MMEKDRPLRHGHPTKPPGNLRKSRQPDPAERPAAGGGSAGRIAGFIPAGVRFFPDGGLFSRPIFSLPDKNLLMGRRSSECRAFPVPDIFSRPDQPAESTDGPRKKAKTAAGGFTQKGGTKGSQRTTAIIPRIADGALPAEKAGRSRPLPAAPKARARRTAGPVCRIQ